MNDNPVLIACTSNALTKLQLPGMPFACWLHFEKSNPSSLAEAIRNVVKSGCVQIFVSGVDAPETHDKIDDFLLAMNEPDVATIWHSDPIPDMAWEFLNVDFTPTNADVKVISVFAEHADLEMERIGEIIAALRQAMAEKTE